MKRKLLCYLLVLSLVLSCPVTGIKMTVQAADTDTTVTSEDGLYQYEELAEGGISITAYKGENTGDELVIPAEIDGKTVKAIGWKGLGGLNASKLYYRIRWRRSITLRFRQAALLHWRSRHQ